MVHFIEQVQEINMYYRSIRTRFINLNTKKTTNSKKIIKILKKYVIDYETPVRIISDGGSCFAAKEFAEFLKTKMFSTNEQVERFNRFSVNLTVNPVHVGMIIWMTLNL